MTGDGLGRGAEAERGGGDAPGDDDRDANALAARVAYSLRALRASRGLSQRALAASTGVSKSELARLEAASPPPAVSRWCATLSMLGLEVSVRPQQDEDDQVVPPPHRDGAGRLFPAHVLAQRRSMPPTWWFVRNGGWGTRTPEPDWFWRRRG